MEKNQETGKISYSLKEKFLLVGPEQRINGKQFLVRSLIFTLFAILSMYILNILIFYITNIFIFDKFILFLFLFFLFSIFPAIIIKRLYSIGYNDNIKHIFKYLSVGLLLIILSYLYTIYGDISDNSFLSLLGSLSAVITVLGYVVFPLYFLVGFIFLILRKET